MDNKNVYIAISGGVDSSVAAALLKQQRYNCTGVYMRLFDHKSVKENIQSAKKVCSTLDIPFKIYDFRKQFSKKVINVFVDEYKKGRTPNPCVICNREIKFGLFFDKAVLEGADYIATGHYVQKKLDKKTNLYKLYRGKDKLKDQSYFLNRLDQKQLEKTLFPIGKLTKTEVRELAKELKLSTADRSASQEACFIINQNVQEFLKNFLKPQKGNIVNVDGEVVGEHNGYFNYTIGQRSGLGIGGGVPYYVVKTDVEKNEVVVSKGQDSKNLFKSKIKIDKPHWISGKEPELPISCNVSIRYNHNPVPAVLNKRKNTYIISFTQPQRAPTPGQSAVFYRDSECLGGGIIDK